MTPHQYRVGGLRLASERPLPLLRPLATACDTPEVHIRFARLAPLAGAPAGAFQVHSADCVDLVIRERLRIRISNGDSLVVDAAKDVRAAELQTYLFGPAFAALLHQRGAAPLHAGAVSIDGAAVAVAGASGMGKSTTIRALLRAGCRFLTDDQLVLDADSGRVEPGVPSLKLWRAATVHFSDAADDSARVADGLDKFHVPLAQASPVSPSPLRAICILARDPDAPTPRLERLPAQQAVMALGGLAHHAYVADAMGRRAAIFHQAARLADRLAVFILRRPDDLAAIGRVADLVMAAAGWHGSPAASPWAMERA